MNPKILHPLIYSNFFCCFVSLLGNVSHSTYLRYHYLWVNYIDCELPKTCLKMLSHYAPFNVLPKSLEYNPGIKTQNRPCFVYWGVLVWWLIHNLNVNEFWHKFWDLDNKCQVSWFLHSHKNAFLLLVLKLEWKMCLEAFRNTSKLSSLDSWIIK